MKKLIIVSLVALVLASGVLLSCDNGTKGADTDDSTTELEETTSELRLVSEGGSKFIAIRPETTTQRVIDSLRLIVEGIKIKAGVDISMKTDWLNERDDERAGEFEILIGQTNRAESAQVFSELDSEYDFRIEIVGTKIVIIGGGDVATLRAAEYFVENLLNVEEALTPGLLYAGKCSMEDMIITLDGETSHTLKEIYPNVWSTHYSLSAASKYNQQEFTIVEFSPKQADLYFDVAKGGNYATNLRTVKATMENFINDNADKTPIVAINGDLWMVTYAHARVSGSGTVYKDCSDPVVTKSLTVPRGFNMYDGEIITSSHMTQETPYEGDFYAFGITEDGEAVLGNPRVGISINNTTQNTTASADGVNRLPANNALVMYTDKISSNNALDDAYEVVIDCSYDYIISHGAVINGTVSALTKPGEAKQELRENRIILTARGSRIERLEGFRVGDNVQISITVTDKMVPGNNTAWQRMKNAVGGHIPVIVNGKSRGSNDSTQYPMSVLGIKSNGNVVMLTGDGRQKGYSVGIKIAQLDELCEDLDIVTAFILDGGGSATMMQLLDEEYKLVNRPSDKFADGTYGSPRTVVNTVILSYGPAKE